MIKEIKYLMFVIVILIFIFFIGKYYFSDENEKNSYRSLMNIEKKTDIYLKSLPILENNTLNIIEYVKETKTDKKKKYYFWELIEKDD
jgi:hypothetical protein